MVAHSASPDRPTSTRDDLLAALTHLTFRLDASHARVTFIAEGDGGPSPVGLALWCRDRSLVALRTPLVEARPLPPGLGPAHLAPTRCTLTPIGGGHAAAWLVVGHHVLGVLEVDGLPSPDTNGTCHSPIVAQIKHLLAQLWSEETRAHGGRAHAILGPDHELAYACPAALPLLDAKTMRLLRARLSALPWPTAFPIGLYRARPVRVDGPTDHRVILELEPAQRVRHRPLLALSERQRAVAQLVSEGYTDATIASLLHISVTTVKTHLRAAFEILGVENRVALAVMVKEG